MKITRKFDKAEITFNISNEEIIAYLSSLPLKERKDLVKGLFEKDKSKLIDNIKDEVATLREIIGF